MRGTHDTGAILDVKEVRWSESRQRHYAALRDADGSLRTGPDRVHQRDADSDLEDLIAKYGIGKPSEHGFSADQQAAIDAALNK